MAAPGTSEAFRRPVSDRNPVGFGLHEFIRINSLYSGGFVSDDDVIVVKVDDAYKPSSSSLKLRRNKL
jgi:hypothetical protein